MPKPKSKITDTQRIRADTKIVSRGLNTLFVGDFGLNPNRFGINPDRVTIKRNFRDRLRTKFRRAKQQFKEHQNLKSAIKTFLKTDIDGIYKSGFLTSQKRDNCDNGRIIITKRKGGYKRNQSKYRQILLHEFIHSMHLPQEHIMAHAIETYFNSSKNLSPNEIVELALKTQIALKTIKLSDGEYYKRKNGVSKAEIGATVGVIARELESKSKIRGSGLFYVREICFGANPVELISTILRGDKTKQIQRWLRLNNKFVSIFLK